MLYKTFEYPYHIFLLHKRHLAVDLCEFRLTVGAKVLVAESLGDLEVTVEAGNHQKLLEQLRRLGERIEFSRVHA